jgi:hypothetical protein
VIRPSGQAFARSIAFLLVLIAASAASATEVEVTSVIAEIELPVDLVDERVPLGGLSGLTYDPGCDLFYALTDDRGYVAPPRIYALKLELEGTTVRPVEVITLRDRFGEAFANGILDPEAVALAPDGTLWVATEGEAHRQIPPRIMAFRLDGMQTGELDIPRPYLPGAERGVRSNHGFEGLSLTPNGSRLVAAVESALIQDGPNADLDHGTVVRMVTFDSDTGRVSSERAYRVEAVPDKPIPITAYHSIGVSEILALGGPRVLVVERSYSAGFGNRVRIFLADLETGDDITGVAAMPADVNPVHKTLVTDLADLGIDPDNIEGLAFGPVLADGRPTLVMVADNNFHPDVQANQLLVVAFSGVDVVRPHRPAASINEIQSAAHVSPLVGRCVEEVEGTVTAILGQRKGQAFWLQQTPADDDPATSEGLFVTALDGLPTVSVGDALRLTGRVEEPLWRMELPVTRLVADGLEITEHDRKLPPPVVMGGGGRSIPTPNIDDDGLTLFEPESDAVDFYESLEGMRVRVRNPVVVGPTSNYGDIVVLGDEGFQVRPRSRRGGVVIQPENNHPERVMVSGRLVDEPPAAMVGGRLAGAITGVLHYSYGSYKVLNTEPVSLESGAPVEPASTTLAADGDHVTVATFNVENLFVGSDEAKFAALAEAIVHRLGAPTVLALQEIQDDTGPVDDGVVSAESTLAKLVDAVVAAGGPRYGWRQIDPADGADGGRPGANIRVALLFDPGRGRVEDRFATDQTVALVAGSRLHPNPALISPADPAFVRSRKPLAVEIELDGRRFFFIVSHLRSKGGDDPLFGRRQPPVRSSEDQRASQTALVRSLVDEMLAADPQVRIIVLGDLNDFDFREPIEALAAVPMVNLMKRLPESERSTYVYQGNSQILDHIIVSPALAEGAELEVVHVNSEFPAPERASDHDPVIARFKLR